MSWGPKNSYCIEFYNYFDEKLMRFYIWQLLRERILKPNTRALFQVLPHSNFWPVETSHSWSTSFQRHWLQIPGTRGWCVCVCVWVCVCGWPVTASYSWSELVHLCEHTKPKSKWIKSFLPPLGLTEILPLSWRTWTWAHGRQEALWGQSKWGRHQGKDPAAACPARGLLIRWPIKPLLLLSAKV